MTEVVALVAPLQTFNLSDYVSIGDLPLNSTEECLLVDFVTANERITTIGGEGNQGWEESGTVGLHWLCPTGFNAQPILAKAESLRLQLRGRRLGKIAIESVEPFMDSGSPIDIDAGWTAYTAYMFYTRNSCG